MAVSLWLLFDQHLYMQNVGPEQTNYYVGTYIILAVGGIMTLVGEAEKEFFQPLKNTPSLLCPSASFLQASWAAAARGRNPPGCWAR